MVEFNFKSCIPSREYPERSVDYLVEELRLESFKSRVPLSNFDLFVLKSSPFDLNVSPDYLRGLHDRGVYLTRAVVERRKAEGDECIQARRGLRVPVLIELHYECVFTTNYPAIISAVMQSAFLGNPLAGETKPWKSPHGKLSRVKGL